MGANGGTRLEPGQIPNLLRHWDSVEPRIKAARLVALFLDFDGTLAPIQSRPEEVYVDPAIRSHLERLAGSPRVRIWIVSGRRRDEIVLRTQVKGIEYLGLHGWEGRSTAAALGENSLRALASVKKRLAHDLNGHTGIWIEDKGATFAVHYRGAPKHQVDTAGRLVEEAVSAMPAPLTIVNSKKVWEVFAEGMENKGDAVRAELMALSGDSVLPVYLGDDEVDEPAFCAAAAGITARVGRPVYTSAHYWLASVAEVRAFLERLDREMN